MGQAGDNFRAEAGSQEDADSNVRWAPRSLFRSAPRASLSHCQAVSSNTKAHLATGGRLTAPIPTDSKDLCPHQAPCLYGQFSKELSTMGLEKVPVGRQKKLQKIWLYKWRLCSWKSSPTGGETLLKIKITQHINTILINARSSETFF